MLPASTRALVLLMALSVGGCTIVTTEGPPPRRSSSSYDPPSRSRPRQPPRNTGGGGGSQPAPSNPSDPSTPASPAGHPRPSATDRTFEATPKVRGSFLFGDGNGGAFRGLAYALPADTARLPNFDAMKPFAAMYLDKFEISPHDFTGGFPGVSRKSEWFGIRYEGDFRVPADGSYTFRLVSDDGAILYVDGAQVVNNDGVHASQSASGARNMRAGKHDLRIDYFHSTGSVSLMVFVAHGGKEQVLIGAHR